jgi:hypothetical protein
MHMATDISDSLESCVHDARFVLYGLLSARRSPEAQQSLFEYRRKTAPGRQLLEAPKIRALAEPTYFAGLRKAGMPEE